MPHHTAAPCHEVGKRSQPVKVVAIAMIKTAVNPSVA
jgi:hypothetical protein